MKLDLQRAASFAQAAQKSPDTALAMTAGWTRLELLNLCLTLAVADAPVRKRNLILVEDGKWTDDQAAAAHSAFNGGARSPRILVGERVYQRRSKARRRTA